VLARYGYLCGLAGLILLVLPGVLPASISQVNGAKLWIRVGPVSLQPGEFAKLLIIVFAAALLVQMRELFRTAGRRVARMELPRARDLAPLLAAWLLPEIPSHGSACPTELEAGLGQAMIATLRHRLIRVPARLVRHAGTLTLRLPPGHHLLAEILARIRALPRPS